MTLRILAQAVDRAALLVDNVSQYVSIGHGVVLYVAFLAGCTDDVIKQAVSQLTTSKIFLLNVDRAADEETKNQGGTRAKPLAISESTSCDVLVVPQATLAGKIKGKTVQYHQQIPKDEGRRLYMLFCLELEKALGTQSDACRATHLERASEAVQMLQYTTATSVDEAVRAFGNGFRALDSVGAADPFRRVIWGTYGNRQALSFESPGPYSHSFEF